MPNQTIRYYNDNAEQFLDDTLNVDMSVVYNQFLAMVPAGSRILDAGCGSGRDALAFSDQGFKVAAFDASEKMVEQAQKLLPNADIKRATFSDYSSDETFDAIWACASLLHVPEDELPGVLSHLSNFLAPEGVFYCSFKYGDEERHNQGRDFTDLNEERLHQAVQDTPLHVDALWVDADARPGRGDEQWLNAILKKSADAK
ncbi:class I SAM-dependent methyltransferase [Idiomarina seosinensis]|uniref:SAM-dependent methyltransferase n=1 Tax=Idiomarina seosinensis TaxID=281739 RepID=A0A432ZBP1_9GAMM|nr:class I SAM-dependent methyltransferase [Idiomarina seosinensis]RUO75334.1 SAM-dependent methyltransferase [Idiomarina seosinensis]